MSAMELDFYIFIFDPDVNVRRYLLNCTRIINGSKKQITHD